MVDAPAMKVAFRVEADGVTIQGLEIRFRRTGLYLIGDNVTVEDCSILLADPAWRTSSCGAWMGGIRGAAFRNCAFTGCGIAVAGPPLSETSHLVPVLTGLFEVGSPVISSPPTPSPTVQLTGSPCSMPPGSRALWRRRMRGDSDCGLRRGAGAQCGCFPGQYGHGDYILRQCPGGKQPCR